MAFRLHKDRIPSGLFLKVATKPGKAQPDYGRTVVQAVPRQFAGGGTDFWTRYESRALPQAVSELLHEGLYAKRRPRQITWRDLHKTLVQINAGALDAIDKLIEQRINEQVEQRVNEQVNAIFQKLALKVDQASSGAVLLESSALQQQLADVAASREMLTANQIGSGLGISDETVRLREQQGEIFAVLQPGRKRGRQYPGFQLWPGIAGEPLKRILARLGTGGASAYQFFTSPNIDLASLSPLQVLSQRALTPADFANAKDLLALPDADRLAAVERAAGAFAASLEA
jgi:hypothetical protein